MLAVLAVFIVLSSFADARVTFPLSEVLQKFDLYDPDAPFNCIDGCRVYVDSSYTDIQIAQDGVAIADFAEIFGNVSFVEDGYELPAGENYTVHREFGNYEEFVFYAVSATAPNYGAPVSVLQSGDNLWAHSDERYHTIITSEDTLVFNGFSGDFPAGYPKLYSTGYDTVSKGDSECSPVYTSRSPYPQLSSLTVRSPIVTIDFGFEGAHSVSVTTTNGEVFLKTPVSSTIYVSEGFVGCPSTGDQSYEKITQALKDKFTLDASSLDITASYNELLATEAVKLRVNGDVLDFSSADGSSSLSHHYDEGTFAVDLSWARGSITSSWALQLDFGLAGLTSTTTTTSSTTMKTTTMSTSPSTSTPPSTTVTAEKTTSSSHVFTVFVSMVAVFLAT